MTTREQAEKAAAEMFPDSATPSTAELLRMGFVRGAQWREALLPSVDEVAHRLAGLDPYAAGPDAMHREMAQAVLALVNGDTSS